MTSLRDVILIATAFTRLTDEQREAVSDAANGFTPSDYTEEDRRLADSDFLTVVETIANDVEERELLDDIKDARELLRP
jgi:hypothetical protein